MFDQYAVVLFIRSKLTKIKNMLLNILEKNLMFLAVLIKLTLNFKQKIKLLFKKKKLRNNNIIDGKGIYRIAKIFEKYYKYIIYNLKFYNLSALIFLFLLK